MVEVAFVIFQGSELAEVARFVVGKEGGCDERDKCLW